MEEKINYTIDKNGYYDYASFDDLKRAINKVVLNKIDFNSDKPDIIWFHLFCHLFGNVPNIINNGYYYDTVFLNPAITDYFNEKDYNKKDEMFKKLYPEDPYEVDVPRTLINLIGLYKDNCIVYRSQTYTIILTNDFIAIDFGQLFFYSKENILPDKIRNIFVKTSKEKKAYYRYVIKSSMNGFNVRYLNIEHKNIDLELLYNDDLPHQQIMDFIKSNESGLLVMHGEPGTGKSSYLRYLIEQFPDNKFTVLDASVFDYMTDSSLIDVLTSCKNCAIILEDCEKLVKSRNNGGDLSALLNLSDGLLGDNFNFKFICTFNTELTNIDSALLRKGRLKMKYEFGKLSKEKVAAIAEKNEIPLTEIKEMTLADVMNYEENNGSEKKTKKRIGF